MRGLAEMLTRLTQGMVALAMAVMTAVVVAEVFARYGLNRSLYYSEELSRLCFIWTGFLGASLALRQGLHVGVDALRRQFPRPAARATAILGHGLVLLLLLVVLASGLSVLPAQWPQETVTLGISVGWFYLAIPVGAALMICQVLVALGRTEGR